MAAMAVAQAVRSAGTHTVRRLVDTVPKETVDDIYRCAVKRQTGVSLKYMMDFGSFPIDRQLLMSAQFLHKELPIRLAHRVTELENLPHGLSAKAHVLKVRDWYVDSFRELREVPDIKSMEGEQDFTKLLTRIKDRHANVVPVMAMGVQEVKKEMGQNFGAEWPEIHQFLDGFYMSRIGIRMLLGQHIELHAEQKDDHIGMIHTRLSPYGVVQDAIDDARSVCMREMGDAPEVTIYGDPKFQFAYVPGHLHQMTFELVKNSLRAVYQRYEDADDDPPAIRVIVAEGEEDVCIKISDEGGGIPRSGMSKIWTYLYSTAQSPLDYADPEEVETGGGPGVLAGYGYGLPISRLYAKYFGGDLQIISMEGYGTDAYLHLNRLGNVQEPLP